MPKDPSKTHPPKERPDKETYVRQDPNSPPLRIAIDPIPPLQPPLNDGNPKKNREKINRNLKLFFQVAATVGTLGLLVVNILLWCSTDKTLAEIQKQTTLMRQQAVGTQSAVVALQEPNISRDPITHRDAVFMGLLNQGHVIAPDTHMDFEIDEMTFPGMTQLSQPQKFTVVVPQLLAPGNWSQSYPIPSFPRQEQQFSTQKRTFTVKGTFKFDNGFGERFDKDFCYSYIGLYNTRNANDGSTSGGGGFVPCEKFKDLVSYVTMWQLR